MKSAYSTDQSKKRRWPKVLVVVGFAAILLIITTVLVIRRSYEQHLRPLNNSQEVTSITIPLGASAEEIANILEDAKIVRAAWAFEWYVRTNDARDALQAGTYPLRPSQSVQEIVSILTNGKVSTDLVTILPAKRLKEVEDTLINYGFDETEVKAALDPTKYSEHPALVDKPAEASLEGYLFPESFQRTGATTPEEIIRGSLDEMHKVLTPDLRANIAKQGITVHQAIILASIIEQESGASVDRPTIAQVFLKRYRMGMQLGSDVTAMYGAITDGVPLPSDPAKAAAVAISYDSPYNTRRYVGLPPGPISNVSKSSLEAIASPSATDFLFFVAGDPDAQGNPGKTYFANTVQEHDQNVANYCKVLCN